MQRRVAGFVADIVERADEIGQQFDIARAIVEMAGKAQLARAVPGDLGHRDQALPGAIPGPPALAVEAVAARASIGEGRVDMGVAVDPQILLAPPPGQLARVDERVAAAFGDQPGAGHPLDRGQDLHLVVGIDEAAQGRGLVIGRRQQPHEAPIRDLALPHAPPRSASR